MNQEEYIYLVDKMLIRETKRRIFQESIPRIKKCLNILSDEEIWQWANSHTPSIGNLVVHLCGNVRQWIGTGLGKLPDDRIRDREFEETSKVSKDELVQLLNDLQTDIEEVLDKLSKDTWTQPISVQGFNETGLSVLVHVIEHFSYHTGQIAYYTKVLKDTDLNFYEGRDLNVTG